jgi:hypothetical protein
MVRFLSFYHDEDVTRIFVNSSITFDNFFAKLFPKVKFLIFWPLETHCKTTFRKLVSYAPNSCVGRAPISQQENYHFRCQQENYHFKAHFYSEGTDFESERDLRGP